MIQVTPLVKDIQKQAFSPIQTVPFKAAKAITDTVSFSRPSPQAYIFDLDKTFALGSDESIHHCYDQIKSQQGLLVYDTARSVDEFKELQENLAQKGVNLPTPDYFIGMSGEKVYTVENGDFIEDADWTKQLLSTNFTFEKVKKALDTLSSNPEYQIKDALTGNVTSKLYQYTYYNEPKREHYLEYLVAPGLKNLEKDLDTLLKQENITYRLTHTHFYKKIVDELLEHPVDFKREFGEQIAQKFKDFGIEDKEKADVILLSAANKGDAAHYLMNKLGINRENIVTAGDGGNDASLIDVGKLFICVGNAKKALVEFIEAHKISVEEIKTEAGRLLSVKNDDGSRSSVLLAEKDGAEAIDNGLTYGLPKEPWPFLTV